MGSTCFPVNTVCWSGQGWHISLPLFKSGVTIRDPIPDALIWCVRSCSRWGITAKAIYSFVLESMQRSLYFNVRFCQVCYRKSNIFVVLENSFYCNVLLLPSWFNMYFFCHSSVVRLLFFSVRSLFVSRRPLGIHMRNHVRIHASPLPESQSYEPRNRLITSIFMVHASRAPVWYPSYLKSVSTTWSISFRSSSAGAPLSFFHSLI